MRLNLPSLRSCVSCAEPTVRPRCSQAMLRHEQDTIVVGVRDEDVVAGRLRQGTGDHAQVPVGELTVAHERLRGVADLLGIGDHVVAVFADDIAAAEEHERRAEDEEAEDA